MKEYPSFNGAVLRIPCSKESHLEYAVALATEHPGVAAAHEYRPTEAEKTPELVKPLLPPDQSSIRIAPGSTFRLDLGTGILTDNTTRQLTAEEKDSITMRSLNEDVASGEDGRHTITAKGPGRTIVTLMYAGKPFTTVEVRVQD